MKLAVFDFDSTLMDGETIDFLAFELGIGAQVTKITEEAMSGRLDFFESLTTRVALLKGMDYQRVVDICADLPLMPGAMELVPALQKMGYKVVCFSGGFRIGTTPAKEKLGLDADFSNVLHEKDGKLILVTAINPTPLGEGKTTVSIAIADGLSRIGKKSPTQ